MGATRRAWTLTMALGAVACSDPPPGTSSPGTSTGATTTGESTGPMDDGPPLPPMQRVELPAGMRGASEAAGDLDGDGNLDLVVSDEAGTEPILRVWSGDGTGLSFTSTLEQAVSREYVELFAGDYEGDGDVDVLGRTGMGARMYLHPADAGALGDGDYDSLEGPPIGPAYDLNGDGLLDHAHLGEGTLRFRLADGEGGFTDGSVVSLEGCDEVLALAFGPLAGERVDAVASVVCGDEARLITYAQSAGGSFIEEQQLVLPEPWVELALADLDDDGEIDAAGSTFAATPDDFPSLLMVRRGTGDPGFEEEGPSLEVDHVNATLRAGDVDGDGRPELLSSSVGTDLADPHEDNRFVLVRLRGNLEAIPLPEASSVRLVADFNADGCGDVLGRAEGDPVLLVTDCGASPEADSSGGG